MVDAPLYFSSRSQCEVNTAQCCHFYQGILSLTSCTRQRGSCFPTRDVVHGSAFHWFKPSYDLALLPASRRFVEQIVTSIQLDLYSGARSMLPHTAHAGWTSAASYLFLCASERPPSPRSCILRHKVQDVLVLITYKSRPEARVKSNSQGSYSCVLSTVPQQR